MRKVDDRIAAEAVRWLVRLQSGEATDEEHKQFASWRQLDEAHNEACDRIEQMLSKLSRAQLDGQAAATALAGRRTVVKNLLGVGMLALSCAMPFDPGDTSLGALAFQPLKARHNPSLDPAVTFGPNAA